MSLKLFALNCCVPETLSKIVLGSVSSAVSTVTDDRDDEFAILVVVSENAFESVGQAKEVLVGSDLALQDSGFDGSSHRTAVDSASAELLGRGGSHEVKGLSGTGGSPVPSLSFDSVGGSSDSGGHLGDDLPLVRLSLVDVSRVVIVIFSGDKAFVRSYTVIIRRIETI